MKKAYHFIVCQHVPDGVRFALKTTVNGGQTHWLLLARGGLSCSATLGFNTPWDYTGISSLLGSSWDQSGVTLWIEDKSCRLVLPASLNPCAQGAVIERLRSFHPANSFVQIILTYENAVEDLPPLEKNDRLTMLWEVREVLTSIDEQRLMAVVEKSGSSPVQVAGIQFYLRDPTPENSLLERQTQIETALHSPAKFNCITL